jgi:hypothetical protein
MKNIQLIILALFVGANALFGAENVFCDRAGESQRTLILPEAVCSMGTIVPDEGAESSFPLDWEGTYDGGSSKLVIRRSMEMHLDPISEGEGETVVKGTINLWPYVGDYNSVYEGSYEFSGTFNRTTGEIVIQGNKWVSFPVNQDGGEAPDWDFFVFSGNMGTDKLAGTTILGNWKMYPKGYDGDDIDSGFQLARDNNSFVHDNSENGGFAGTTNYVISTELFNRLKEFTSSESEVNALKKEMYEEWYGSCYGISVTMGLTFKKLLSAEEISGETLVSNEYFRMPQPKEDQKLKDIINYYQLSQFLENYGDTAGNRKNYNPSLWSGWIRSDNAKHSNVSLSGFLNNLVKDAKDACEKGSVLLFGFTCRTYGHLVLITGYSVSEDGYRLTIYDMNSVDKFEDSGHYTFMNIAKDLLSFTLITGMDDIIDEDNYVSLSYLEPTPLDEIKYCASLEKVRNSNYVTLLFSADSQFTLKSSNGKTLTYKRSAFSGDLPISSVNYKENRIKIKTKRCEAFKIAPLGKNIDIQVYDDDNYKAVKGKNIRMIDLSLSGKTKLCGSAYTFKAYSSVEEMLDKDESGLAAISGKARGPVTIRSGKEKVEAKSRSKISHVKTAVYQDVRTALGTIKGRRASVSVNAAEDLSNRDLNESGRIFFGKDVYVFRGNPVKPKVSVFAGAKGLKKGRDYKVSYSDNKGPGTGTVTVTGIGEYKGEISATFPIVSK